MAVAVVERFKQELMYGLSAGTKKVAAVERWPLVEVRLYLYPALVACLCIGSLRPLRQGSHLAGVLFSR